MGRGPLLLAQVPSLCKKSGGRNAPEAGAPLARRGPRAPLTVLLPLLHTQPTLSALPHSPGHTVHSRPSARLAAWKRQPASHLRFPLTLPRFSCVLVLVLFFFLFQQPWPHKWERDCNPRNPLTLTSPGFSFPPPAFHQTYFQPLEKLPSPLQYLFAHLCAIMTFFPYRSFFRQCTSSVLS